MSRLLRILLALCLPTLAAAQGVRFDNYNVTSATNTPYGAQSTLFTLPFSQVTVCAYPDDGGQPCGNVIPIYSDPALTQTADNPITADVHGRFGFWLAPGTYTYSVVTQGGVFVGTYIFTLGNGGNSDIVFQTNGVNNLSQVLLDLDQGTGITVTNTSGGHVLISGLGLEQQTVPPIGGQYVVVYPTVGTITEDPRGDSVISSHGGKLNWSCVNDIGLCTLFPNMTASWTGFSLPSYVDPASVTAVYADAVSGGSAFFGQMPTGGAAVTQLICTGMAGVTNTLFPSYGSLPPWGLSEKSVATTLTGATVSTAACNLTLGASTFFGASGISVDMPAVRLLVYYTGPPPPTDTGIKVLPPLCFDAALLTLGDCSNGRYIDGGADQNILTLVSSNTGSSALILDNTSVSGGGFGLFEGGSANGNPGSFGIYNYGTAHQPFTIKANDDAILLGNVTARMYQETLTTPASSSAACTAGQFTDDAGFHYVCTATNTWKRVALASF